MEFRVLVNPEAGGGKPLEMMKKVKEWLPQDLHKFHFEISKSREHLLQLAQKARDDQVDGILAYGGDGTLHDILPYCKDDGPALGHLPCGRGNDFPRNMNYPTGLENVCKGMRNLLIHEIDLPTAGGLPYTSIAGTGFDALVAKLTRDGICQLSGTICYVWYLFKALIFFKPVYLNLKVDDEKSIEGHYMLAAFAKGQNFGGGMRLAPGAELDNGFIDVVLVEKMTKISLLKRFSMVYKGTHIHEKDIKIFRAKKIEVSSPQELELFADGEFAAYLPATVEVGKHKLRIIIPR